MTVVLQKLLKKKKYKSVNVPHPHLMPVLLSQNVKIGVPFVPRVCSCCCWAPAARRLLVSRGGGPARRVLIRAYVTLGKSLRPSPSWWRARAPVLFLAGCRAELHRPPGVAPPAVAGWFMLNSSPVANPERYANCPWCPAIRQGRVGAGEGERGYRGSLPGRKGIVSCGKQANSLPASKT